jgi:hypothetical protein
MHYHVIKYMLLYEGVNGGLPYSELSLYILLNSESKAIILPISE